MGELAKKKKGTPGPITRAVTVIVGEASERMTFLGEPWRCFADLERLRLITKGRGAP